MMGYMAFSTIDNTNKEVSCLQEFVLKLLKDINSNGTNVTPEWLENFESDGVIRDDGMKAYRVNEGFGLFEM